MNTFQFFIFPSKSLLPNKLLKFFLQRIVFPLYYSNTFLFLLVPSTIYHNPHKLFTCKICSYIDFTDTISRKIVKILTWLKLSFKKGKSHQVSLRLDVILKFPLTFGNSSDTPERWLCAQNTLIANGNLTSLVCSLFLLNPLSLPTIIHWWLSKVQSFLSPPTCTPA